MLLLLEVGRRIGIREISRDAGGEQAGVGAIESAVFGLFGLLIAFTFSGAITRFDGRRQLVIEETNAIGTAYLRVDLLPTGAQPALRDSFRRYLEARLVFYKKLPDLSAAREELVRGNTLQGEIWRQSVSTSRGPDAHSDAAKLLLPALNETIDITTTRTKAMQMHLPLIIFAMLFGLALASTLLAGYGMATSKYCSWFHRICFGVVVAVAVYVILDLEYPRLGLDPRRCLRPGAGRITRKHEVNCSFQELVPGGRVLCSL
jgi:hypothetical protein